MKRYGRIPHRRRSIAAVRSGHDPARVLPERPWDTLHGIAGDGRTRGAQSATGTT